MTLLVQTPDASAQSGARLVGVDAVKAEPLTQTVPVIGRLVALRSGNVAARLAGYVDDIRIKVGDSVKKGQLLALLSTESLKADVLLAESELLDAKAELVTEKAQADLSKTELRRQQGLKSSVAFSQAKFEDAQKKLAVANAQIERANAKVKIKEASLQQAKLKLAYASVAAPYDGVVVQSFTEKGSYLRIGDPIIKLIDVESLEVEADVPANRVGGLATGVEVTFQLNGKAAYKARVRSVLPSENSLTRTRTVRFSPIFSNKPGLLAEGQSLTISIPAGEKREIVTVSKDAILKRGGADIVYIVQKGKAMPRPVTLGEGTEGRVEVLSGLKAGDLVVVRGNERLFPGVQVRFEKSSS
ncbi:MAG: efflux RND transporter periplasmic adaptor subunit [Methyloligellaceae bacterium]